MKRKKGWSSVCKKDSIKKRLDYSRNYIIYFTVKYIKNSLFYIYTQVILLLKRLNINNTIFRRDIISFDYEINESTYVVVPAISAFVFLVCLSPYSPDFLQSQFPVPLLSVIYIFDFSVYILGGFR